jgi:anti-anti-sigma factor
MELGTIMNSDLKLSIKTGKGVALIEVAGNITHDSIGTINRNLNSALQSGFANVVLRLDRTHILLSTGIHFFVEAHDKATEAGGSLVLAEITKEIAFTLEVTKINDFFIIEDSVESALARFGVTEKELKEGIPSGTKVLRKIDYSTPEKEQQGAKKSEVHLGRDEVKEILRDKIKNRVNLKVLEYFVVHENSFADSKTIALKIPHTTDEITSALKHFESKGILKDIGGGTYNYAPSAELGAKVKEFFHHWNLTDEHAEFLKYLIELEGK